MQVVSSQRISSGLVDDPQTRAEVFPDGPKLTVTKQVHEFEHPEEKRLYDVVSQRD